MKLAAYYLLVSAGYAMLYAVSPRVAESAIVGFVALLLLIPAIYAEALRIRHGRRD